MARQEPDVFPSQPVPHAVAQVGDAERRAVALRQHAPVITQMRAGSRGRQERATWRGSAPDLTQQVHDYAPGEPIVHDITAEVRTEEHVLDEGVAPEPLRHAALALAFDTERFVEWPEVLPYGAQQPSTLVEQLAQAGLDGRVNRRAVQIANQLPSAMELVDTPQTGAHELRQAPCQGELLPVRARPKRDAPPARGRQFRIGLRLLIQ